MTATPAGRTVARRAELGPEIRASALRLLPAAAALWLLMCGVGYVLAHPLTDSGYTSWEGGVLVFVVFDG